MPGIEETTNQIQARVKSPGDFVSGSFKTKVLSSSQGISAIIGKLKGETTTTIQSYRFDKGKGWTKEKAKKWCDDHKIKLLQRENGEDEIYEAINNDEMISVSEEGMEEDFEIQEFAVVKKFNCECVDCGFKVKSDKHCKDIKCEKCGGEMRRAERPGPGKEKKEKEFMDKARLNFKELFSDMKKMDAIQFKEKYGIEKTTGKMILDKLWLEQLATFDKEFEVYAGYTESEEMAKTLKDIQIFEPGYHNGKTFTSEDVKKIFDNTKKMVAEENLEMPIKLGHSKEQAVAKTLFGEDTKGMPALGWLKNLKMKAGKIYTDLVNIPDKLFKMINEKMYGPRSVELWHGYVDSKGNTVGTVLTALALLGAETPAVTKLAPLDREGAGELYSVEAEKKGDKEMTNKRKDPVDGGKPAVGSEGSEEFGLKSFQNEHEVDDALKKMKKKADEGAQAIKDLAEYKKKVRKESDETFLSRAMEEGRLLPWQAEMMKPILAEMDVAKEVSYFELVDEETKLERKEKMRDLLVKIVDSLPNQIKFKELSKAGDGGSEDNDLERLIKIEQDKDSKLNYDKALKIVLKQNPGRFDHLI